MPALIPLPHKEIVMNHENVGVPPAPGEQRPAPTLFARLVLWLVLVVVAVHSGLVALWVAPNNLLRQSVGSSRVSAYVLPMWDQAWSVFAPEADSAYDRYEVRALVRTGSGETRTAWTPVTARELLGSVRHHPFPARTALLTTRLGGHVKRYYDALNQQQKKVVAAADREVSVEELRAQLTRAATTDAERARVAPFMRAEAGTERFLSGVADALWGSQVVAIQFRKDKVVASRYTAGAQRQVTSGFQFYSNWRPQQPLTAAERSAYRDYVARFDIR